jgi:tetratricopeptide (TPR) repeat protein
MDSGLHCKLVRTDCSLTRFPLLQKTLSNQHDLVNATSDPHLAASFRDLADRLHYHGRREEALDAIEEAVGACRHFAVNRSAASNSDLGQCLRKLAHLLHDVGRLDEALQATRSRSPSHI